MPVKEVHNGSDKQSSPWSTVKELVQTGRESRRVRQQQHLKRKPDGEDDSPGFGYVTMA